ncbi:MAG: NAD(P)/FAD-dependent oxidoreductase [archaeon]
MIVGAGVVGCYLGKLVGDCEIWELRNRDFDKPCGGLVSKNVKKLDVSFSESVANEVRGARFFSERESFEVEKRSTQAFVLDKQSFHASLVQDAVDNGCRITYARPWRGEEDDYIIGADGANSSVMRACGIKRKYFAAYQIECELSKRVDDEFVELHFGDFAPGFFGWMIPTSARTARIGLACADRNSGELFKVFSKKFLIKKITKKQAALIPKYDGKRTVFGNIALVGDAAGQVKASTGGGIVFGCLCAEELAKALKAGDLNNYEKGWRQKYEQDLRTHLLVRRLLDSVNYDKLFRAAKEKNIGELIEKHGDMEHLSGLKRALLRKPFALLSLAKAFI